MSCAPASPCRHGNCVAAGLLRSPDITPVLRYSEPIRHRLAVSHFPGLAGYVTYLLHRFLDGTRTVSPVAWHALVTVLSLMPRRNVSSLQSVCDDSCCLRPTDGGSASGAREFRGHLWVHLRYGPVTRSPSFMMALSVGFIRFVSSSDATQASGFLTFAPVGLSPTEHASLRWTHVGSGTGALAP